MFKEGDIVELVLDVDWLVKGDIGTIRHLISDGSGDVGVDWGMEGRNEWQGSGHRLNGHIRTNTGWYVHSKHLRPAIIDLENK